MHFGYLNEGYTTQACSLQLLSVFYQPKVKTNNPAIELAFEKPKTGLRGNELKAEKHVENRFFIFLITSFNSSLSSLTLPFVTLLQTLDPLVLRNTIQHP